MKNKLTAFHWSPRQNPSSSCAELLNHKTIHKYLWKRLKLFHHSPPQRIPNSKWWNSWQNKIFQQKTLFGPWCRLRCTNWIRMNGCSLLNADIPATFWSANDVSNALSTDYQLVWLWMWSGFFNTQSIYIKLHRGCSDASCVCHRGCTARKNY